MGDADSVLDWTGYSRDDIETARESLGALPEWEVGAAYVRAASSVVDRLDAALDDLEEAPLGEFQESTFRDVVQARLDLIAVADAITVAERGSGCSLGDVMW